MWYARDKNNIHHPKKVPYKNTENTILIDKIIEWADPYTFESIDPNNYEMKLNLQFM